MNQKNLEKILLSKSCSVKEFPFGDDVAVFKVKNKMFALYGFEKEVIRLNLKCDPNDAIAYREIYKCVIPGYHMNKKHWNTIVLDGSMEEDVLKEMIDKSYNLVVSKLTKREKEELKLNKD
ncbi:MmcQ/YjbR family DNA-binding protein [Arcobacter sp. LA11]|uniref:MmcQ/YjbR family DNA-binding protein n=1 Tax=Arcobacter sp. LA11 TaxID=1898176 RepID=UPI0009332352|nr:MmcQ/YjbR family DNA-binding protein [Arcobacter sp. LA11]